MIVVLIAACEVAFWVVLGLGLALRYPLRRPRLGAAVLVCVPLVDVILLVATAVDLHRGAEPTTAHGLAAAYLGFSLAFGHPLIRWADVRFAHRFAGGPPPPPKPAKGTPARMRALWTEWARVVLAAAIATVVVGLLALVTDAGDRGVWIGWVERVWIVAGLWLVFGPLWEVGGRRGEAEADGVSRGGADRAGVAGETTWTDRGA